MPILAPIPMSFPANQGGAAGPRARGTAKDTAVTVCFSGVPNVWRKDPTAADAIWTANSRSFWGARARGET